MRNQSHSYNFLINLSYIISVVAIAGLTISIISISLSYKKTGLKLSTDFELADGSYHATDSIPCTNKTLGNTHRTFYGETYLGTPCPKSDNPCLTYICGGDGFCTPSTDVDCYSNAQCNSSSTCNLTTCTCDIIPECITDSDCSTFSANPCVETKCISNECVTDLIDGAECSSSTQCSENFLCNSTCLCSDISSILAWSTYTPTVDEASSNIGLQDVNFYDGAYYRIEDGYVEVQFYLECSNSTTNDLQKNLTLSVPPGIMLDATTNGDGVFTIAASQTFLSDTTIYSGSGNAFIFSSSLIGFTSYSFNQPTGATTLIHYISATFLGKLA